MPPGRTHLRGEPIKLDQILPKVPRARESWTPFWCLISVETISTFLTQKWSIYKFLVDSMISPVFTRNSIFFLSVRNQNKSNFGDPKNRVLFFFDDDFFMIYCTFFIETITFQTDLANSSLEDFRSTAPMYFSMGICFLIDLAVFGHSICRFRGVKVSVDSKGTPENQWKSMKSNENQ